MDWNHIRAFHATATAGSLSAAARTLGLTQPTLSRQIQAFEAELGLTLFERIGRKLVLTDTGAALLAHVNPMREAADAIALAASGEAQTIGGRVTLSATDALSAYILPEIVAQIRAEAPNITVAILASNALSDLHRREADIALRHVPPDRAGLTGRHILDTEAGFYASRDWVRRHGHPKTPADLASAGLIGFEDPVSFATHLQSTGIPMEPANFRLLSDSSITVWEMARRGMGVAAMLTPIAERTDGMVRLVPEMDPIRVPLWLITHQALAPSPRIRLVQQILAEELSRL
ncbi:LysR family transcriptional regulator [Acuticoccus kandeliae]|uniref:LysR family transcriptional regulator n=1 Tax=Acuticoccus kandeliae TaxID=2073160 RepID=UPI001FEA2D3F|nr:LysR family transcriptional regulator [Acuticoccus kandeliae]